MTELFKIFAKIQIFLTFLMIFEIGGGEFGQKRCKGGVQYFRDKLEKFFAGKLEIFPHLDLHQFSPCPSQKFGSSTHYKLLY